MDPKDSYCEKMKLNEGAPVSWCPLPWSHFNIRSSGFYRLCCHSNSSPGQGLLRDHNQKLFHISSANWDQVMNSQTMKSVRKNMLRGKWSKECIRCQREFESGMNARNMYERTTLADLIELENYPHYTKAKAKTKEDGSISAQDFPISFLDIRFGNLCNLKCIMCGPTDSSKWNEDYYQLTGRDYFNDSGTKIQLYKKNNTWKTEKNIYNWSDNPYFWGQMEKHIKNLRKIYIVGGEPLLIKAHYDFLQKCVDESIAQKVELEYNSNVTELPRRAWAIWKHFKVVKISASLDGWGKINDFIRYPSQWSKLKENLNQFNTVEGCFSISFAFSVSVLNIWHFPVFIEKLMEWNFKRSDEFYSPLFTPHPVHMPKHLNVNILGDDFKEKIIERFDFFNKKISEFNWQEKYGKSYGYNWKTKINKVDRVLNSYKKYIYKIKFSETDLKKYRKYFISYMDKLDEIRGTQWPKVLPELYANTLSWREL